MRLFSLIFLLVLLKTSQVNGNEVVRSRRSIASRILGGEPAFAGQFKFAAAINIQTTTSSHFCAGALLTNQWILTAGQCVEDATMFVIRLGSNHIRDDDSNRVTLSTSEYVLHPGYDPRTLINDVGLIKLRTPVGFSDYIDTVDYLDTVPLSDYTAVLAIGWGQVNDKNPDLHDLNWVELVTLANAECQQVFGSFVTENMVCVGGNYHEGTCRGDSGGPLIEIIDGKMVHVGISSFMSAKGCDNTDPSGYTRTYPYLEWIRNITLAED